MFSAAIKAHALRDAPREACGMVCRRNGRLVAEPTRNTAPDPLNHFRLELAPYFAAVREQVCVAYYHSHPEGPETASPRDRTIAEHVGLPVFIYSLTTERLGCYRPQSYRRRQPILGRPWLPLVSDAVTTVADYYARELELELPEIERQGERLVLPEMPARRVDEPAPGDLLVMHLRNAPRPNHVGVLLSAGQFLHHPPGQASLIEPWAGPWRNATAAVLRFQP